MLIEQEVAFALELYRIKGGKRLFGTYKLSGAKNAVLPILAATLLSGAESRIVNCPDLSDTEAMFRLLRQTGCSVRREGEAAVVNSNILRSSELSASLMNSMRSSVFLLGPLLARCGEVTLSDPGGCNIGVRPIDFHLNALKQMGAEIVKKESALVCRAQKLRGADLRLPFPSVGATENLLMAAVFAEGETRIRNAAREPEIVDLQNFLKTCGAEIRGAGSGEILVRGTETPLQDAEYSVMPDRIEGGTILLAAAAAGGDVLIENAVPGHLMSLLSLLERSGCEIQRESGSVRLKAAERLRAAGYVETRPYPGFPTDLQSPFLTVMSLADGQTEIRETIFENRFKAAEQLKRMGARIEIKGQRASVTGVEKLSGARVRAQDLRGGAALVLAGLAAEGETIVENICHIDRGYDKFEVALSHLGAEIERMKE